MTRGRRMPGRGRAAGLILAIAGIVGLAACGNGGSTPTSSSTTGVKSGGTFTMALDEDVAGWNINYANDDEFVLSEVMDQVQPSVWIVQPNLSLKLDTDYVLSATETSTSPQTIVYKLNPKAKWSDGVAFNADDFIYNWEAQSGNPKYKDVGGQAFEPSSTAGYNQIKSVTGSDGGETVTIAFSSPFGDWKSLFTNIVAAHIAEKVGWNNGFQNFNSSVQVSGGPYELQSYTKGESIVEVKNPKWWGTPGKLNKIIYKITTDDQEPAALQNGEVNLVTPALASLSFLDQLKAMTGVTTSTEPALEFQHIDFNEANPYLALSDVRHAIAYGTNRQQLVTRIADVIDPSEKVLNNRIYATTQPEYQDTSDGYGDFSVAKAKSLLEASGMTLGSDGYFHPSSGPEKGKDLTFNISTTSGVSVRQEIEELFQADMKAIGIKINIQNYTADTLFGTIGPKSEFDIIEFAWVSTPFASGNESIYCSYTDAALCGENWDHYSDTQVDTLFDEALSTLDDTKAASLYNQADALLWKDMATLPLFQNPDLWGWNSTYGNVIPNTSNIGIPWNANQWGVKAS
jgi:peptide/nickel transport system substrate-binding protein